MAALTARSAAVRQIMRALDLPAKTVAFTLRVSAGEIATLDVEMRVEIDGAEKLATVLQRYKLQNKGQSPSISPWIHVITTNLPLSSTPNPSRPSHPSYLLPSPHKQCSECCLL